MVPWTLVGIYFLFTAIMSVAVGTDAQRRGLKPGDVYGWSVSTLITGIIALLLYFVFVVSKSPVVRASCPRCGKPIQLDWKVCPYCARELKRESP